MSGRGERRAFGGRLLLLVAPVESSLCPLAEARALSKFAEGLQLFGGEDAADEKLGLGAEADERGLRLREFAGAFFDEGVAHLVGVDGLVEGSAGRRCRSQRSSGSSPRC